MREIEFLPDWYPQVQKRFQRLMTQVCMTVAILALLGGYTWIKRWQLINAKSITAQCLAQISQSQGRLAQLGEKLKYESELRRQDQIVAKVGLDVGTTRLLKSLEDAMTPEMSLTRISLETVEHSTSAVTSGRTEIPYVDRRLNVEVDGVAPSDVEEAKMLDNLAKVTCFENVRLRYLRQAANREGHLMREFEVNFELNLNPQNENTFAEDAP